MSIFFPFPPGGGFLPPIGVPGTPRTRAELFYLFPDNLTNQVIPSAVRDLVSSVYTSLDDSLTSIPITAISGVTSLGLTIATAPDPATVLTALGIIGYTGFTGVDTDPTFAANSNTLVPSQRAVKTALALANLPQHVNQPGHGFPVGALTPVRRLAGTGWVASDAAAATIAAEVQRVAVASDANSFILYTTGSINVAVTVAPGAADNDPIYLAVGGGVSSTAPTAPGTVEKLIGYRTSATLAEILIGDGQVN